LLTTRKVQPLLQKKALQMTLVGMEI